MAEGGHHLRKAPNPHPHIHFEIRVVSISHPMGLADLIGLGHLSELRIQNIYLHIWIGFHTFLAEGRYIKITVMTPCRFSKKEANAYQYICHIPSVRIHLTL